MKNARILELDALIEKLRDEYHKYVPSYSPSRSHYYLFKKVLISSLQG